MALVASVFDLEVYPVAISIACSIVLGLIAAATFYCSSELTANLTARLCWASIPVLVAPGGLETVGNAANLHWYLLWLTPWVLMKTPAGIGGGLVLGVSALVVSLSEIQSVLFLPLVFLRPGNRGLWWAKTGFVIGAGCQVFNMWVYPRAPGMEVDMDFLSVFNGYFLNSTGAIFYGASSVIINHIHAFGAAPILVSAIPFAFAALLVGFFGSRRQRLAGSIWFLASAATWTAAVVINPAPYFRYSDFVSAEDWMFFYISRYSVVPSMFLLALLPLLIPRKAAEAGARGRWAALMDSRQFRGGVAGAFLILQSVYYFPIDDARGSGPEWAPGIQAAREACAADPDLASVEIPQAPNKWTTRIRCSDL